MRYKSGNPAVVGAPSHDDIARLHDEGVLVAPLAPQGKPFGARARSSLAERAAAAERLAQAARNVEAGLGHPGHFDILRSIERHFKPEPEAMAQAVRAHLGKDADAGRWLKRYLGAWVGGSAYDDVTGEAVANDDRPDAQMRRGLARAASVFTSRVCVDLHGATPYEATLDKSSGAQKLDDAALEAVAAALARFTLADDMPASRACFLFVAELTRMPPLPVLNCWLGGRYGVACSYPLKEIFDTRVKLAGLEFPQGRNRAGRAQQGFVN
jgi:hypothetical protein